MAAKAKNLQKVRFTFDVNLQGTVDHLSTASDRILSAIRSVKTISDIKQVDSELTTSGFKVTWAVQTDKPQHAPKFVNDIKAAIEATGLPDGVILEQCNGEGISNADYKGLIAAGAPAPAGTPAGATAGAPAGAPATPFFVPLC